MRTIEENNGNIVETITMSEKIGQDSVSKTEVVSTLKKSDYISRLKTEKKNLKDKVDKIQEHITEIDAILLTLQA